MTCHITDKIGYLKKKGEVLAWQTNDRLAILKKIEFDSYLIPNTNKWYTQQNFIVKNKTQNYQKKMQGEKCIGRYNIKNHNTD